MLEAIIFGVLAAAFSVVISAGTLAEGVTAFWVEADRDLLERLDEISTLRPLNIVCFVALGLIVGFSRWFGILDTGFVLAAVFFLLVIPVTSNLRAVLKLVDDDKRHD